MEQTRVPRRVWLEAAISLVAVGLTILTTIDPEWIETIFHVEPDEGAGWLELAITLGAALVALTSAALAFRDYRRGQSATAAVDTL